MIPTVLNEVYIKTIAEVLEKGRACSYQMSELVAGNELLKLGQEWFNI